MAKSIARGIENLYRGRPRGGRGRGLAPALALALLGSFAAGAEERSPYVLNAVLTDWGADVGVGYRGTPLFAGVDTILWVWGGGSMESMAYFRTPDGSLITGAAPAGVDASRDPYYWRASGRWQLGLAQGLAADPRASEDLLEAFLYYRGRLDANLRDAAVPGQLVFLSSLPDRHGLLQSALLAGIRYNDVLADRVHKTRSGISAELSVEWGPPLPINLVIGSSDYLRVNATARGFLPLLALEPGRNLVSLYLCDFLSLDWAFGRSVPLIIRQTFGGLDPRTGLGGALRGVDSGAFDTPLKAVNNLELRATFPALGLPDLVPGLLLFWDAGAYGQAGEPVPDPLAGVLTSVGAGVFLDFFDLTSLTLYVQWRLTGVNADASPLIPPWSFASFFFDLHF
jgi:hypothetical protein